MRVVHCESGAYVYNELITTWYSSIVASPDIEDIDSQTKLYIRAEIIMQAQRIILHTNQLGNLIEQPVLPANVTVEAIFLVEESNAGHSGNTPSPRLKNSFSVQDDLISPLLRPEEWEASLDRTCKQIEGDESAFKAEKN